MSSNDDLRPRWMMDPVKREPKHVYQKPDGTVCLGINQRRYQKYGFKGTQRVEENRFALQACKPSVQHRTFAREDQWDNLDWFFQVEKDEIMAMDEMNSSLHNVTEYKPLSKEAFDKNGISKVVGISLAPVMHSHSVQYGKPSKIILSTLCKQLIIDVAAILDVKDFDWKKLKTTLESSALLYTGYRAAEIVTDLHHSIGDKDILLTIVDMFQVCDETREDNFELDLIAHCRTNLAGTFLSDKIDARFEPSEKHLSLTLDYGSKLKEAYLCAALGHASGIERVALSCTYNPSQGLALTAGQILKTMRIPLLHKEYRRTLVFDADESEAVQASFKEDGTVDKPAHYRLKFNRIQDLPLASLSEVVEFKLLYKYSWTKDGTYLRVPLPAIYTEMYGRIFEVEEQYALVNFPEGIRICRGYPEVPHELLFKETEKQVAFQQIPDNKREQNLEILGVNLIGRHESSPQESQLYSFTSRLLRPESFTGQHDPSNQAILFSPWLSTLDRFKRLQKETMKHSVLSHINDVLGGIKRECRNLLPELYDQHIEGASAIFSQHVPAVMVNGGPGAVKPTLIAMTMTMMHQMCNRMSVEDCDRIYAWRHVLQSQVRSGTFDRETEILPDLTKKEEVQKVIVTIPWYQKKVGHYPGSLCLTQTNEACRNAAMTMKGRRIPFGIFTSSRSNGYSNYTYYKDLEEHCIPIGAIVAPDSQIAKAVHDKIVLLATTGVYAIVADVIDRVYKPSVVILDEASQQYASVVAGTLHSFTALPKLVLFGDAHGLAPHMWQKMEGQKSALEMLWHQSLSVSFREYITQIHLDRSKRLPDSLTEDQSRLHKYTRLR